MVHAVKDKPFLIMIVPVYSSWSFHVMSVIVTFGMAMVSMIITMFYTTEKTKYDYYRNHKLNGNIFFHFIKFKLIELLISVLQSECILHGLCYIILERCYKIHTLILSKKYVNDVTFYCYCVTVSPFKEFTFVL